MSEAGKLLTQIYQGLTQRYYELASDIEDTFHISERDIFYLDTIYRHPKLNLSQFASLARISKPAATQTIQRFEKNGYVQKIPSQNDKRVSLLQLTPELQGYFDQSSQILDQIFEGFFDGLSVIERQQSFTLLKKIAANMTTKKG